MSEATANTMSGAGEMSVQPGNAIKFVDKSRLPSIEKDLTRENLLQQAAKMLGAMEMLKSGQSVEIVGDFIQEKTKIKIVGEGSEKAREVEFAYLNGRYRKLENEALKSRQSQREELEVVVAKHLGKTLAEMGIKFVDTNDNYLSQNALIDVWKIVDDKHIKERMQSSQIIESLQVEKISYFQAIKNLKKVYGSTRVANEKYISQMALGKVFDKNFEAAREHSEQIAKQAEAMDALPDEKKGFWHKVKRATTAIKQTIGKPLGVVGATAKAVTGLALYDYNPARVVLEKPVERIWTKIPISDPTFKGRFPKMEKLNVIKGITMREAAAKLEEKLMVDPLTGEGVRTGAITTDKMREASVAGAEWALKMQVLPGLIAKLPGISALALKPGEIYSMIRSGKMAFSGAKSIEAFTKKFKAAKTNTEKGMLTASMIASGVGFYAAEKLASGAPINPILMADIALMRVVGQVDQYAEKAGVDKTELAETLKTVEEAITVSFAADSVRSVGESLANLVETGSANPLSEITDEASLLKMAEEHPDVLKDDAGSIFGDIRRAEEALIEDIKGVSSEENPWQTFSFEENVVYKVGPGEIEGELTVLRQDLQGRLEERRGEDWVGIEVATELDPEPENEVLSADRLAMSEPVMEGPASAVHDYVYFEQGTHKMAFRMDLVEGETWESKVDRLFEGYQAGGIDDPSGASYMDGQSVKELENDSPALRALTGQDGVYESQIHEMLIQRLLSDAEKNGLVYDQALVKERMVAFLKNDTTADVDTVEGETDYGQLYQNLFVGSQVTKDVATIDTKIYQSYFLSGNEGGSDGVEVNIEIPDGGTVIGQLAEQGYGTGDGKIFNSQSEELKSAQIFEIESDGTERLIESFDELNDVQVGDKFVVRTGEGSDASVAEGKLPDIIPLSENDISSFDPRPTQNEQFITELDWESEVVRNENGEIYVGTVGEGEVFTQMMVERFGGTMDNPWDLLSAIQNMDANGLEIYAESVGANGEIEKRVLNSYDDLGNLYIGERIVIVDTQRVLSDIPDQDQKDEIELPELQKDDDLVPGSDDPAGSSTPAFPPGFGSDGRLDMANPPAEVIRDVDGYIYVGEIQSGMYLSTLMSSRLPATDGVDTWQMIDELNANGQIGIYKVGESGELLQMVDLNSVNIGDRIVIQDAQGLLTTINTVNETTTNPSEDPIEVLVNPESDLMPVQDIKAKLESTIAAVNSESKIGLSIIDLDNPNNDIEINNLETFDASEIQKLAIAMAVLRSVDSGALDLSGESRFIVLPGDYKPSIEHMLNLMLVQNDATARDGLLKELVGQDMDLLLGSDTGLKDVLMDNETTTSEVAKIFKTLLRTTYLSDESRELVQVMMQKGQGNQGGLLSDDLSLVGGIEITEIAKQGGWSASEGNAPEYSTFANVQTLDGKDLVVVITADADNPIDARSAFKTVAREMIQQVDSSVQLDSENEYGADVSKQIYENDQAKLDYLNHVIAPYRTESGDFIFDPLVESKYSFLKDLDFKNLNKEVTTYADGSGLIHLSNMENGRIISVYVDKNQHVSMVLDSEELSKDNINFEVYPETGIRDSFVQKEFVAETEEVEVNISLEIASNFDFQSSIDRQNFVNVVRASDRDYDYYLFVDNSRGEEITLMYGRDGNRVDQGALPANVSIAIVSEDGYSQLSNPSSQAALETLIDKLATTKKINDIVWNNGGDSFSVVNDNWDHSSNYWFNAFEIDVPPMVDQSGGQAISIEPVFSEVVKDVFQVELNESMPSVMVDGVNYTKSIYVPEGMTVDTAVVARANDIAYDKIVVRPTNDANVYLVGETVDQSVTDAAILEASFVHPTEKMLFRYDDGSLSGKYEFNEENPLVSVFPLESPLSSYLDTDRLIKLDEKAEVKIQYQGKPYFVLTDDGVKDDVFIDPYTLESYVKSGNDFIPLMIDSYSYQEIAQVYGKEMGDTITPKEIWERRVVDAMTQDARKNGIRVLNENGNLVIYSPDGSAKTQVLNIVRNEGGEVVVNNEGEFVLQDTSGQQLKYEDGQFVVLQDVKVQSLTEYLQDYEYMLGENGKPLQYRGFPVLSKDDLVYIVSQNGVTLAGSKQEFKLDGYIEDDGVLDLVVDWKLGKDVNLHSTDLKFEDFDTEKGKVIHGFSIENDRFLALENGVMDLENNQKYDLELKDDMVLVDQNSGKIVFKNTSNGRLQIWNETTWEEVEPGNVRPSNEYLSDLGMEKVEDKSERGEVVDRRTQEAVYVKDDWAYSFGANGLERIGSLDAVLKSGFVGYLDGDQNFQTYTPETLTEIYGNPVYTVAERATLLLNPLINEVVGSASNIVDLWADFDLKDVLPTIKKEDYIDYEELPRQYVSALIAQENKNIYRGGEGEATNLDLGVLVKVLLSGGERGGSTLAQGLVKNLLMSPEDRLERSLNRKVDEVLMADQILEDMSVEEVVSMYANSVSYGSLNGHEVTGVGEAAEFLFGKELQQLDLVETGLMVAIPNYPTRNNAYTYSNALGWADSASGVYRHMFENGFITEDEMQEAFVEVHEKVLSHGTEDEIELMIELGVIKESDREWALQEMKKYNALGFEERMLKQEITLTEKLKLGINGLAGNSATIPTPVTVAAEPEYETTQTLSYADFYDYLNLQDSSKLNLEELDVIHDGEWEKQEDGTFTLKNAGYYWYGKTLALEESSNTTHQYLKIDGDITPPRLGVEYTTNEYDPEAKDYTPRVNLDDDGNVVIDSWSHRYDAIEKTQDGDAVSYNVVGSSANAGAPLVQDNQGKLWEVSEIGLINVPGRVYQVEDGGAVQAMPANDRPGILFDITGQDVAESKYVKDAQGNYYKVLEGTKVEFVGQAMTTNDGRYVLYDLDAKIDFELAKETNTFLNVALKNILNYRNINVNINNDMLPVSNDPNEGYVAPRGQGEYGLINPLAASKFLYSQGITSQAVELSASRDGKEVFESYLTDLLSEDKGVLVWLNNDLASDVIKSEKEDGSVLFESISRHEKPVSVLQIFQFEGNKYVVYQDPTQSTPQVVHFDIFAKQASPNDVGRYKTLVMGKYEINPEYSAYLYDPRSQYNQVGALMADGYAYNIENPTEAEAMMSINPVMQSFTSEEAKKLLEQNGGNGVVAMAMDQNGRVIFDVSLDADGQVDTEVATKTYQPGSVYKLITAMWAMQSGVNPSTYFKAGDSYEWEEGDTTFNWTKDPVTGLLKYAKGADETMNLSDAIKNSNNPYFLGLVANAVDFNAFAAYARQIGFGDSKGSGNMLSANSIIPDPTNTDNSSRSAAYNAIGQADVAVTPKDMMEFVAALSNGGRIVAPTISRELPNNDLGNLPNDSTDFAVMVEAMQRVTSEPGGTAYEVFHDVDGYEVYGKTGTAETGEDPNAWFVGWAVNKETGEKISFVFLIPNGGEGSHVAAPLARIILDKYFSDLTAHKAMEAAVVVQNEPVPETGNDVQISALPTPNILDVSEVEQGVSQFRLEDQPNKDLILLATEATRISNSFEPSSPDIGVQDEGKEFVSFLKTELSKVGYASLVESAEMEYAFDFMLNEYKTYGGESMADKESVQCVAWQIFMGGTRGLLAGAPVAMSMEGDAEAVVYEVMSRNLNTGDPSPIIGGTVIRFAEDKPDISLMDPGDSFFAKYPGEEDSGHTGLIVAEAYTYDGQPTVLVSDANRFVDENGNVISDGKIRLRWLTQAEFDEQYSVEGDRTKGIAPSQFVVIRPDGNDRVQSILDPDYHRDIPSVNEVEDTSSLSWQFESSADGLLHLPFENSENIVSENVGEMQPVDSVFVHWSGAASNDPNTWTADMVVNGLAGEETSSTFAVGVDKIIQMANYNGEQVQETYATPWQHGAVNIEIAGQDFDTYPPSKEQYQRVLQLVTQILVTSNKPVSIVQPHYKEIYMWSSDMPNRLGEQGNWMKLDSYDLKIAKYWDQSSESWLPVSGTSLTYDPDSVQSKVDPGEKFFAKLIKDVKQELVAQGRSDLAGISEALEGAETSNQNIYTRIIDDEHPITREEIQQEIVPNLESVDAIDDVLAEAAIDNDILIHASSREDLTEMIHATREAGVDLYITSGYRSFAYQLMTYLKPGNDESSVMQPGKSQHHTGLALDFTSEEIGFVVDEESGFEQSKAGIWLADNGWKYGYVQSYTKNHDGIVNEAWHYYYVGKEIAKIWHNSQQSQDPQDIFEILEQYQTGGIRSQ